MNIIIKVPTSMVFDDERTAIARNQGSIERFEQVACCPNCGTSVIYDINWLSCHEDEGNCPNGCMEDLVQIDSSTEMAAAFKKAGR